MNAIGSNHQICTVPGVRCMALLADAAFEVHCGAPACLRDIDGGVVSHYRVRSQTLQHGLIQQHLQVATMDRKLRPAIARVHAALFAPHHFTALGGVDQLGSANTFAIQRRE